MASIPCRTETFFMFCPALWDVKVLQTCIDLGGSRGQRGLRTAALLIQSIVCRASLGQGSAGYSKIEGKGSARADPAQPSSSVKSWGLCCFRWLTGSHGLTAEAKAHVSIQWGCSSFVSSYLCLLLLWKHLCGSQLLWSLIKETDLSLKIQGL